MSLRAPTAAFFSHISRPAPAAPAAAVTSSIMPTARSMRSVRRSMSRKLVSCTPKGTIAPGMRTAA